MSRTQSKNTPEQRSEGNPKPSVARRWLGAYWRNGNWWRRFCLIFLAFLILWTSAAYGISRWYMASQASRPLRYGVTFIPSYARYFGLDPEETMKAMIDELGVRQFRLVSYWNYGEPVRGEYDFSELDWQFRLAEESGSKVSLAIGLRQPRWPECHMPEWAAALPKDQWAAALKIYMQRVIERYKDSPALESYQLENEFFMKVFGICPDHTRERLVDEYNFVKTLDQTHPVIVSRSNNWVGVPVYAPIPDISGVSVYKRVWEKTFTKRYFEYPLPAWFYGFLGGAGKLANGKDLIIHELQAESWMPPGYAMNNVADIPEQNKSLNAQRLHDRFEYGRGTGLREIYVWGAEWWYWRKVVGNDPSLWNVAREEFNKTDEQNRRLAD